MRLEPEDLYDFPSFIPARYRQSRHYVVRRARQGTCPGERRPASLEAEEAEETLYLYEGFDYSDEPWATKYRVSLGPDQYPPPPSHLEGIPQVAPLSFNSQSDYERAYSEMWLMPEDVDQPLDGVSWENVWEFTESPQAKAHQLLADLNLDATPRTRPQGWPHPLH